MNERNMVASGPSSGGRRLTEPNAAVTRASGGLVFSNHPRSDPGAEATKMYSKPVITASQLPSEASSCCWITLSQGKNEQGQPQTIQQVGTGLPSFPTCTNPTLVQLGLCRVTVSNEATGLSLSVCGLSNYSACATAPGTAVTV
jgi:hypothetical protein